MPARDLVRAQALNQWSEDHIGARLPLAFLFPLLQRPTEGLKGRCALRFALRFAPPLTPSAGSAAGPEPPPYINPRTAFRLHRRVA